METNQEEFFMRTHYHKYTLRLILGYTSPIIIDSSILGEV